MDGSPNRRTVLRAIGATVGGGAVAGAARGRSRATTTGDGVPRRRSQQTTGDDVPRGRFVVEQGDTRHEVAPLSTGETIETFYDYYDVESHTTTDFERSNVSHLFFFRGPRGLSLVFIHDRRDDQGGGDVVFEFEGVPEETDWAVRDDNPGNDNYSTDSVDWQWGNTHTDGGALRGDLWGSEITIRPNFQDGIDEWLLMSCGAANPEGIPLDMTEPVTIDVPPLAGTADHRLASLVTVPTFPNPGEPVDVVAPVLGGSGSVDATLYVDDRQVASQSVSLSGDGPTLVRWTPDRTFSPGTHSVRAVVGQDAVECATVRVPKLGLREYYSQPAGGDRDDENEITAGDAETVVELDNPTDESVTATLTLAVDGDDADSHELSVPPGATLRPMIPWNGAAGRHHLQMEVDVADGGTYALEDAYDGRGRAVPTAVAFSAATPPSGTSTVDLGRLVTADDLVYDPASGTLLVPFSGSGDVSVRVLDGDGTELGTQTASVDTEVQRGTGNLSERRWVEVSLDESVESGYLVVRVEEEKSLLERSGTLLRGAFDGLVGRPGPNVDAYVSAALGRGYATGEATTDGRVVYRHVVLAEVSGYPQSVATQTTRQQSKSEGNRQKSATAAVDELTSNVLPDTTDETEVTETTVLDAADSTTGNELDETGLTVDLPDPTFTNSPGQGWLTGYRYGAVDPGIGTDAVDESEMTAVRTVDLKVTGVGAGTARVTVSFTEDDLNAAGVGADELELQYYRDGAWQSPENVDVDPDAMTATGEIPVGDLARTPVVLSGPPSGGGFPTLIAVGGGIAAVLLGLGVYLLRDDDDDQGDAPGPPHRAQGGEPAGRHPQQPGGVGHPESEHRAGAAERSGAGNRPGAAGHPEAPPGGPGGPPQGPAEPPAYDADGPTAPPETPSGSPDGSTRTEDDDPPQ